MHELGVEPAPKRRVRYAPLASPNSSTGRQSGVCATQTERAGGGGKSGTRSRRRSSPHTREDGSDRGNFRSFAPGKLRGCRSLYCREHIDSRVPSRPTPRPNGPRVLFRHRNDRSSDQSDEQETQPAQMSNTNCCKKRRCLGKLVINHRNP